MAFIDDRDKLLENQDQQNQQQQTQMQPGQAPGASVSSGQARPLGGEESAIVGQGSGAGGGAGGLGSWTNIQSYISANANDTGSAKMIEDKVGSQFEQEKKNLQESASKVQSEAQKAAASVSEAQKNAGSWLDQAGQGYDWSGQHQKPYQDAFSKLSDSLYGEYKGPRSFTYDLGNQTQAYGQTLGNQDAFQQWMGNLYQEKAGGPLSTGGRALQQQLDVNNKGLVDARDRLLQQYSGLGSLRDQTVADTTKALSGAESQFRTGQNALRDYLSGTSNQLESAIGKQESDARAAYEREFKDGRSGLASVGFGGTGGNITESRFGNREREAGVYGDNLTWDTLRQAVDFYQPIANHYGGSWVHQQGVNDRREALENFYQQQDQKYANVADTDERKWNTLRDLLKMDKEKKQQGFRVRG